MAKEEFSRGPRTRGWTLETQYIPQAKTLDWRHLYRRAGRMYRSTDGGMGSEESGPPGTTLETAIFKRLTDQPVDYDDDEKTLNAVLKFAEKIKNSADYMTLKNMDWSLEDTSNFESNFEHLVETVLGELPEQNLSPNDEKRKCFRTLTLLVYAADMYLALENDELKQTVKMTVENLHADWTILTRLRDLENGIVYNLKLGAFCLAAVLISIVWLKSALCK